MASTNERTKDGFREVWDRIRMSLPLELKRVRMLKGLTQHELAELTGIDRRELSRAERGELGDDIPARIISGYAYFCGCPVETLLWDGCSNMDPRTENFIAALHTDEGQMMFTEMVNEAERIMGVR